MMRIDIRVLSGFTLGVFVLEMLATFLLRAMSGGRWPLEVWPRNSPTDAYELLDMLGQSGRSAYLYFQALDLAFIAMYVLLFTRLLRQWRQPHVLLLAVVAGFLDALEDVSLVLVLVSYPSRIAGFLGILTWITLANLITFWAVVIVVVWRCWSRRSLPLAGQQ